MSNLSDAEFVEIFGAPPNEVAAGLVKFSQTAQLLSSDQPRLIDSNAHEWVGICGNSVAASGPSMDSVIKNLKAKGIDPSETIIRYIDAAERTLIL